ncbi:MAG: hypothetical protein IJ928_07400 [Prevotella sp.]|nr:hypothetical protein [Prevotella sp.]
MTTTAKVGNQEKPRVAARACISTAAPSSTGTGGDVREFPTIMEPGTHVLANAVAAAPSASTSASITATGPSTMPGDGFVKIFHGFYNLTNSLTANFEERFGKSLPSNWQISP